MLRLPSCVSRVIIKSLFFIISTAIHLAFSNAQAQEFFNHLEDSTHSSVWLNLHTIDSGYAHSGYHYSIADSAGPYGLGLETGFPEKHQNRNTILRVEAWVKSNVAHDKAGFVISLMNIENQVFWKNVNLSPLINQSDTWYYFSDSIVVPASVTMSGRFKMYLWNNDQKNTIAIDDLKIDFKLLPNPTFIPDVNPLEISSADTIDRILFSNNFYSVYYNENSRSVSFYNSSKDKLITNLWYFKNSKSDKFDNTGNGFFILAKAKKKKDETILIFKSDRAYLSLKMELICFQNSPEIRFRVEEKYKAEQNITREAIVIQSELEVSEVFRSNRKSDREKYQSEYWLGKQGVKFGKDKNSWMIYNQPEISSIQLNTEKNQLWVNLDYEKDHPFLHFPLKNDTADVYIDWSESHYNKGDKRIFSFSVCLGVQTNSLPRLMKNPNGYLATYIWTEHADFTNLRTNRATYFGYENITDADSAIGGFVKYQIPVSKSVFYSNPDQVTNSAVSGGEFTGLESSIKEDDHYLQFLKQIRENGSEICLHTPENFTTNMNELEFALGFMQKEFHSPTWIDHGYNNGLQNNREDLVCDGTLKKSDYYSMKLWEKYGVRYFWNPYYEDYFTFENWNFGEFLVQPYHGFGDFIPDPDFWAHSSRTGNLIHWPTKSVLYIPNDHLWDFYFNDRVMNDLVDSWSVDINHCYPAWVDPEKGFWVYDSDSTIVAAPGFNRTLERMANLRDQNKLNVTTVRDFLDYQLTVEKVNYEILPDGRIRITNQSNELIKGLSFATKAKHVLVNDQIPEQKIVGDDIVFWFDLIASQSKLIRLID